jgi:hypothetical protein
MAEREEPSPAASHPLRVEIWSSAPHRGRAAFEGRGFSAFKAALERVPKRRKRTASSRSWKTLGMRRKRARKTRMGPQDALCRCIRLHTWFRCPLQTAPPCRAFRRRLSSGSRPSQVREGYRWWSLWIAPERRRHRRRIRSRASTHARHDVDAGRHQAHRPADFLRHGDVLPAHRRARHVGTCAPSRQRSIH